MFNVSFDSFSFFNRESKVTTSQQPNDTVARQFAQQIQQPKNVIQVSGYDGPKPVDGYHVSDDTIQGSPDKDIVAVGPGKDLVDLGDGPDSFFQVMEGTSLTGHPYSTYIDTVHLGDGSDIAYVDAMDTVFAGPGADFIKVELITNTNPSKLVINGSSGWDTVELQVTSTEREKYSVVRTGLQVDVYYEGSKLNITEVNRIKFDVVAVKK